MVRILRLILAVLVVLLVAVPAIMALVGLIRLPVIDQASAGDGPVAASQGVSPSSGGPTAAYDGRPVLGVSCQRTGAAAFDLVDSGEEEPGSAMTVAVDLIDTGGARHRQVVVLAADSSGARGPVPIWGPATAGGIDTCVVTAVQVADRVVYTGW